MHVFNEGRQAFLEYLRNLTPQALVLTIATLSSHRLAATCCDLGNLKATLLAVALFGVWAMAVWANSTLFITNYLVSIKKFDDESQRLVTIGVRGFRNMWRVLDFARRENPMVFVELIFVGVVVEIGLVSVVLMAMGSAGNILKSI